MKSLADAPAPGAASSAWPHGAPRESLRYRAMGSTARTGGQLDELLRRVADGDVDAFGQVYDLTRARVFGLVFRVLRDPGYSEETTQEVYLQVWRGAGAYDPGVASAVAWIWPSRTAAPSTECAPNRLPLTGIRGTAPGTWNAPATSSRTRP